MLDSFANDHYLRKIFTQLSLLYGFFLADTDIEIFTIKGMAIDRISTIDLSFQQNNSQSQSNKQQPQKCPSK